MPDDLLTAQPRNGDAGIRLVRSMAAGDTHALDTLYQDHGPAVLSFLIFKLTDRVLAEEVLQDVMLAAWKHASDFRGDSSVRTWLLVIARNRAINALRRYRPKLIDFEEVYDLQGGDTEPLEKIERANTASTVRDAMRRLPQAHREVLELVFYHQLSGIEVAQVLGVSAGTVKSRLHRAKEALRKALDHEGNL